MSELKNKMYKIILRYKFSLVALLLFFISVLGKCIYDYYAYPLPIPAIARVLFSSFMILSSYTAIALTPVYFLTKRGTAVYIISMLPLLLITFLANPRSTFTLVLVIVGILAIALASLHAYYGNMKRLKNTTTTNYILLEYNTYCTYQLNLENMSFNIITILLINILNNASTIYVGITLCILMVFMNYKKLFNQRLKSSKWYVYLIELISIILAYATALFGNLYDPNIYVKLLSLVLIVPHVAISAAVYVELKSYMFKFK